MAREEFDYIVVGRGSSGSVAAARLVKDGGHSVLLLEGGHSQRHPLLEMPPGIFKMIDRSKYMRYHTTEPQPHLGGREHDIPQASVFGGGSSVSAQVYKRGRPSGYDAWDDMLRGANNGANRSFTEALKHFRHMEDNNRLNNSFHGVDGPMQVSDPGHIDDLSCWFVQTAQGTGEPFNPDFNGASQRGVGFYQFVNRRGRRSSATCAFLEPRKDDRRLDIRLQSRVDSVLIENGRVVGVARRDRNGQQQRSYTRAEVILAAGALIAPKLLMLSGVGPAEQLRAHGLDVIHHSPGVGENLIDHPETPLIATFNGPYGYYKQGVGWRMLRNGLHFKPFGASPIISAGVESGAFANPRNPGAAPTIKAFCVPIDYLDRDALTMVENAHGVTITKVLVKPQSRGDVRLRSANPQDKPRVSPNVLQHPDDMAEMIAG